jgi:hypothetical protein
MIDPMTSLAFSVYASKGVYALLLGSGISRASGIMTGWEIVQDLIRKAAVVQNQDCGEDPARWYETTYGKEPDYSNLLEMIARTSAERGQLLRSYFEPSEQDREEGRKVPTRAHRAIARLVSGADVRVIVTTNFDRLLEQALETEGIVPAVISSPDAALGSLPLAHARCTVIKVHGDYLDPRLKNTRQELAEYAAPMNRLLDQVFDEYGLIVCGWSAEWDIALQAALTRALNRRFTTYWSAYGKVRGAAQVLCQLREAEVVAGKDADTFFGDLAEKVASLVDLNARHPVATPVAVATLKRYLAEDRHRIRLEDFVMEEVKAAVSAVFEHPGRSLQSTYNNETRDFIKACDAQFDRLARLLIAGGYWGKRSHGELWFRAVERVTQGILSGPKESLASRIAIYPAILEFYACGIASLLRRRYATLARLQTRGRFRDPRMVMPLMVRLLNLDVFSAFDILARRNGLGEQANAELAVSPHLASVLREPFREILPDDEQFQNAFARFEYFNALVFVDWSSEQDRDKLSWTPDWAPSGVYTIKEAAVREAREELTERGARWPLLKMGIFGGSVDRLQKAVGVLNEFMRNVQRQLGIFVL